MTTSSIEDYIRKGGGSGIILGPPGMYTGVSTGIAASDGLYQAPEPFQLGEVVHIPYLWGQAYSNAVQQNTVTDILGDNNWNSWTEDPAAKIDAQTSGMTWVTRHTTPAVNTYYVEYWYAFNTQTTLTVADANGYQIGDTSTEPQDIFGDIQETISTQDKPFTVKGFKLGTPIPSVSYFYKFKAYLGRVVYVMADATTSKVTRYFIAFVPLSTNAKGFAKVIAKPERSVFTDLPNADVATYLDNFNKASLEPAIADAEWLQTDNVTDSLRIVVKSGHMLFNSETTFTNLESATTLARAQTFTLDPNVWESTDKPYYAFGIASPQATIEAWVSHLSYGKISIIYRAIVRGWVVRSTDGTVANNSDLYIYSFTPPAIVGGTYTSERLLGISSTTSSSSGVAGVTYQAANELRFYRQVITRDGKDVPQTVLANIPEYIIMETDTTSDLIGSLVAPSSSLHMKIKASYTGSSTKVYGQFLSSLLQQGSFRWSQNEGQTWSSWQTMGQTTPYINPASYLGTGTLALNSGFQTSIGEVSANTYTQPGEYLTTQSVDSKKLSNDFIDISFTLT